MRVLVLLSLLLACTPTPERGVYTLVGGLSMQVIGSGLVFLDGRGTNCTDPDPQAPCRDLWDTSKFGMPLVIIGGAAAVSAMTYLMYKAYELKYGAGK